MKLPWNVIDRKMKAIALSGLGVTLAGIALNYWGPHLPPPLYAAAAAVILFVSGYQTTGRAPDLPPIPPILPLPAQDHPLP